MDARNPKHMWADGTPYAWLVDPLLAGLRGFVVKWVPENAAVVDACSGTGRLARELAPKCASVLGVDLSPRMVDYAERMRLRDGVTNARFRVGDAAQLCDVADGAFDVGTIVLGLHEMPATARVPVLRELARIAGRILAVDFAVPMPWNVAGFRNRLLEVAGGPEHFAGFRDYTRRGGLQKLSREAGLEIEEERSIDKGTLAVVIARRGT